ncbi:MAG: Zn-ribbon domain-containing OB-fold protein [Acidimicrobiales bacterium]
MTDRSERQLTGPFWAAVDRSELVRPVCGGCGRSFFTPQVVCPHCQSREWTYEASSGRAVVYSHTTIHRPPDSAFVAPYVVGDVEVEEGWRMLTWIVNCNPEDVVIGLDVEVCFVPGPDGDVLPAFQPRTGSGR